MTREEARKLLSGYATGQLTELEQQLLFDAALEDQELFDELAAEQAVKELVELPGAKRRLLEALGPEKKAVVWWPWAAGVAAVATVVVAVWLGRPEATVEVARVEPQASVPLRAENEQDRIVPAAPPVAKAQREAQAADVEATVPVEKSVALADAVAKAAAREEALPVQEPLEARARLQLPTLVAPQAERPALAGAQGFLAGNGKGKAKALDAPAISVTAIAPVAAVAVAAIPSPGTLTYEVRDTGILRMTASRAGVIEVSFDGRPLYPARAVAAGETVDVSIPLEAKQLRIDFAGDANAPAVAAQTGAVSGTLTLPPAANPRAVIVIPAQR